jgi:hypothetical protein
MVTYDLNNAGGFFRSEMHNLGAYEDDDMDDEFTDAPEHQAQYDGNDEHLGTDLSNSITAIDPCNRECSHLISAQAQIARLSEEDDIKYNHALIQQAEQGFAPHALGRSSHYDPHNDLENIIEAKKPSTCENYTAAYHSAIQKASNVSQGQHISGCAGTRGASTPPVTPPPEPTQSSESEVKSERKSEAKSELKLEGNLKIYNGPDDLRHIAKVIVNEKRWHDKVAHLHPRVPLASHRYWIGVLNPGQNPRTASKEEHFTWMKGNRLTTVETVSKIYAATTMLEGGVFIMGGERPKIEDRMEELDLFNDKVVLFSVTQEGTPASVGRLLTRGLVPEIVVLDD